jgi:hypothetical protein
MTAPPPLPSPVILPKELLSDNLRIKAEYVIMVVVQRWRYNENGTRATVCGDTVYQTAQPVPDKEYETIP